MSFKQKAQNWSGTALMLIALAGVSARVANEPSVTDKARSAQTQRIKEAADQAVDAVSSGGFVLVPAHRVFDSRSFATVGLQPGHWYGVGTGIHSENLAYVTLTITTPGCAGFITVDSQPGTPPVTSFVNWGAGGDIVSNSTFVPITDVGDFYVWVPVTTCPMQVVVDLIGYVQR